MFSLYKGKTKCRELKFLLKSLYEVEFEIMEGIIYDYEVSGFCSKRS